MIIGLSNPTSGSIEIFGEKMDTSSISVKKLIGYVSDNSNRFLKLKGIEYLNFISDFIKYLQLKERQLFWNYPIFSK